LAGSSYQSNGWAVADGVKADEQLQAKFSSVVAKPRRTYVWGDSLGGLITELVAEKHPDWVDGAAPMCGAVAGPDYNFDLALDVSYAVRQLVDPALKVTGYTSADDATANWKHAAALVTKAAGDVAGGGTAKILTIAALADAPTQTRTYDGHDLTSQVSARVETLLTALAFSTSGRYEIEQRVGGNPSQNADADYDARLSESERELIETAGGHVDRILAQLDKGPRVTADAAARSAFEALGDTTGKIVVPTLTMHTEADPLVIVQNEGILADRAEDKGASGLLSQLYIKAPATYPPSTGAPYGAGHCIFSDDQRYALITALDTWVRRDVYPTAVGLKDEFGSGLDPTYVALPWPAAQA
jgi:pimeloyl-ACP methyl ester carboxylesterase